MQLVSWPVHSSPFFPSLLPRSGFSRWAVDCWYHGRSLDGVLVTELGAVGGWSGDGRFETREWFLCNGRIIIYPVIMGGISRLLGMDLRESNLECAPWVDHTKQYRWLLILFNYYLKEFTCCLFYPKNMCFQDVF